MNYINRLVRSLSKLFTRKEHPEQLEEDRRPPSRYRTPLRPPSRVNINSFGNANFSCRRQCSYPENLCKTPRLPTSTPLVRSSSHLSLPKYASAESTPFRPGRFRRSRRIDNNFQNGKYNKLMDFNHIPKMANMYATQKSLIPEICLNGFQSSSEYQSVVGESQEKALTACFACGDVLEKQFSNKQLPSKNNQYSLNPGFADTCNRGNSKIPVGNHLRRSPSKRRLNATAKSSMAEMNQCSCRQRGQHNLSVRKTNSKGNRTEPEDSTNNSCKKPLAVGNWVAYRTDTSGKFERVFKSISKKKHAIGNLIDSTLHSKWMQLAGITVDKDAFLFRQFAGGKIVLTLGEYKFLLDKICSIHDFDYWDVLRKMATFDDGQYAE